MRKEPFGVGDYVHTIKRGARGLDIVLDDSDRWRFVLMLRHFNDKNYHENWFRDLIRDDLVNTIKRPYTWPEQEPIVKILCYTLMGNHFHLMLNEIEEDGISDFMHRLSVSMVKHFNDKYEEKGSIFQGSYKAVTVKNDQQLQYLAIYIMVKNVFEMYPEGGLEGAMKDFDKAWSWAIEYPYSSLGDYAGIRNSPIIDKDTFEEVFDNPEEFKSFAKECMQSRDATLDERLKLEK